MLDASLHDRSSRLILRQGEPLEVLTGLLKETGSEGIFAEADFSPYARQSDRRVQGRLPLFLVPGVTVHPPEMLKKVDDSPYTVFTPFSRMWRSLPFPGNPAAAPERMPAPPTLSGLELLSLPRNSTGQDFPAGETEALRWLDFFPNHRFLPMLLTATGWTWTAHHN